MVHLASVLLASLLAYLERGTQGRDGLHALGFLIPAVLVQQAMRAALWVDYPDGRELPEAVARWIPVVGGPIYWALVVAATFLLIRGFYRLGRRGSSRGGTGPPAEGSPTAKDD